MEENKTSTSEVKTETPVEAPKESAPAKKKSHKLLYIVLIILGIVVTLIVLAGVAVKNAYNSIDPDVKKDLGKVYECSKKCQAMPKDQQNSCVEQCAKEAGLDKYMSPAPASDNASVGSVDSSGVYSDGSFSFTPPSGWTQGSQEGVAVMFTNPKSPQTSINVVSESAPGFSLTDYVKAAKEQLSQAIPGYKVSNEKSVTVNGVPAYQMDGAFSQSGLSLVNRQLIVVDDGTVYVLTATSTPDAWASNMSAVDTSLKTIKYFFLITIIFTFTILDLSLIKSLGRIKSYQQNR